MSRFMPAMTVMLALACAGVCHGQQMLHDGFEGRKPVWVPGRHDADYKEIQHRLSGDHIHGGQHSETVQIEAQSGTYIHYTYNLGRAPVTEDFNVSLWIRANRPGVQLLARVVFPHEFDTENTGHPLTVLLPGERYQNAQHWVPLSLPGPVKLLRQKQLLLANALKRPINIADAYVDQLVLNVFTNPGETQVWIDDLEAGPVFESPSPTPSPQTGWDKGGADATPARPVVNHRPDEVRLESGHLKIGSERLFMLAIRHTGTPLDVLRLAGFNTVCLDESAPSGLIEQAASQGFWIVPMLHPPQVVQQPGSKVPGQLVAKENFGRNVGRFLRENSVLTWDIGDNLPFELSRGITMAANDIHNVDPLRPLAVDVRDGFLAYSRAGNQQLMIGVHRWPLLTSLELTAYRDWLMQRRLLLPPDAFCWTWIQTHLPDWFMTTAYEKTSGRFDEPIGPQPEQIRLLTYIALGCGYRGLGYWSDRFLADSHMGRDRLLALARLNQELRMLEPILVNVSSEPEWVPTYLPTTVGPDIVNPNVMAAVLRCDKAVLVLPIWMGLGAQYVPPQGFIPMLKLKVPLVPDNYTAWEVSPGRFQSYASKPVLGGKEVIIRNFNLTSAIVFTGDLVERGSLVPRFQELHRSMRRNAAQWTHDQAQEEIVKAARIHDELKKMGKKVHDGDELLNTAREWLDKSRKHRLNGEFEDGYADAQLALRAVRLLMRAHWDNAVKRLSTPVACPFALSFYTLPRFWQYLDDLAKLRVGKNVLPDGDFEWPPDKRQEGWGLEEIPSLDDVEGEAKRVANDPREGKQCLMLRLTAKNAVKAPKVLERTFLAIHSPAVHLPPGTPVRISGWVRVPGTHTTSPNASFPINSLPNTNSPNTSSPISGSPDGALLYDSAGGEPLAVRIATQTGWRQFVLYRAVPDSGLIHVSMALTGLGTVYFDDIRIEPMAPKAASEIVTTTTTTDNN